MHHDSQQFFPNCTSSIPACCPEIGRNGQRNGPSENRHLRIAMLGLYSIVMEFNRPTLQCGQWPYLIAAPHRAPPGPFTKQTSPPETGRSGWAGRPQKISGSSTVYRDIEPQARSNPLYSVCGIRTRSNRNMRNGVQQISYPFRNHQVRQHKPFSSAGSEANFECTMITIS